MYICVCIKKHTAPCEATEQSGGLWREDHEWLGHKMDSYFSWLCLFYTLNFESQVLSIQKLTSESMG